MSLWLLNELSVGNEHNGWLTLVLWMGTLGVFYKQTQMWKRALHEFLSLLRQTKKFKKKKLFLNKTSVCSEDKVDDTEIFSKSAAIWDEHKCQNTAHSELSNFLLSHRVEDSTRQGCTLWKKYFQYFRWEPCQWTLCKRLKVHPRSVGIWIAQG